jgi:hypothetical protein
VISGLLPRGLRLVGSRITGTPVEVVRTTEYKFVVRAIKDNEFSDRTFNITVSGSDEPMWITPGGPLPVGTNQAYYVLDSVYIDFQLEVSDTDVAAGQQLNFFISSNEGELPPGLILLPNGRITGFIQPLLQIPVNAGDGSYDNGKYDSVAYDYGFRPSNGYDTYIYDSRVYDFFITTSRPRKLNRNYEFIATITDGETVAKRKFRIYVVGDDFFRADNVITTAGEGTYTADVTYVRAPIFTTPSYLGLKRANNYQTLRIDVYEGFSELGPVTYSLAKVNALINGVCVKETSADNRAEQPFIRIEKSSATPQVGQKINFYEDFNGATDVTYTILDVDILGGDIYRLRVYPNLNVSIPNGQLIYIGTDSVLPPGMQFDASSGEVIGVVPYQPAVTNRYAFTVKATRFGSVTETSTSRRVFTVDILGEVESFINWKSPDDLGIIDIGYVSTLSVIAESSIPTSAVLYTLDSGTLPPGLSLNLDGEIVGRVNQLREQNTYKGFWKSNKSYDENDIVKLNNSVTIKSAVRRKNTASIITNSDHGLASGELVNIVSDNLSFNFNTAIAINVDPIKLESADVAEGTGPYRVTFSIPEQLSPPLAPVFTLIRGTPGSTVEWLEPVEVNVKSTSGAGQGARFKIFKLFKPEFSYTGVTEITLLDHGSGYLPGDTITISGADLPDGVDGLNDLTFTLSTGLEFYYKINGNSNNKFNGRVFAIKSTNDSITLGFSEDPGSFGLGLISTVTGPGTYEAITQITPLNFFSYPNKGTGISMVPTEGFVFSKPTFYKSKDNHISGTEFDIANWNIYDFPDADKSITTYDKSSITFDGNTTSIDRKYTFTVTARDQLGYSAVTKTFTLSINIPNDLYYSNITARPFLKQEQRDVLREFVNDPSIFDPRYIYRPGDPYFGIQTELKMLVYAGIETKSAAEYISAIGRNHKIKRFHFGELKKAEAKIPGTNTVVYEAIYIDMLDPLEIQKKFLPTRIKTGRSNVKITVDQNNDFYTGDQTLDSAYWQRPIPFNVTLDRNDLFAGDPENFWKFPSSISLWRYRIKNMKDTSNERNYLPLWMRSIQQGNTSELNYVPAVVLCYCRPGKADEIMLNIKNSNFDFKQLDYTIDRYIIDSITGEYADKYLVFRNDRTTIS